MSLTAQTPTTAGTGDIDSAGTDAPKKTYRITFSSLEYLSIDVEASSAEEAEEIANEEAMNGAQLETISGDWETEEVRELEQPTTQATLQ